MKNKANRSNTVENDHFEICFDYYVNCRLTNAKYISKSAD